MSGRTLRPARPAYTTYGTLDAERSNAIVDPAWYSGRHWDNEWLIGPGMALDPRRWFIIVPDMLGNGLSSSPPRRRSAEPPRRTSAGARPGASAPQQGVELRESQPAVQ